MNKPFRNENFKCLRKHSEYVSVGHVQPVVTCLHIHEHVCLYTGNCLKRQPSNWPASPTLTRIKVGTEISLPISGTHPPESREDKDVPLPLRGKDHSLWLQGSSRSELWPVPYSLFFSGICTSGKEARTQPGPLPSFASHLPLLGYISKTIGYPSSSQAKVCLDIVEENRSRKQFVLRGFSK